MNLAQNQVLTLAGLATLGLIGSLMSSHHAVAQGPPSGQSVNIVNPLPVPITGSATVSGTVAASQSGAWNVALSGTPNVSVANTPTVRDADQPARNFVNLQFGEVIGSPPIDSYMVPTGKVLVIETVSPLCLSPPSLISLHFRGSHGAADNGTPNHESYIVLGDATKASFTQAVKMYAKGGQSILFEFPVGCTVYAQGYMINDN